MRKVVIIGGKLQGTETAYLGKKAGMEVTLIDSDPHAAAQKLFDEFICADVLSGSSLVGKVLEKADLILPATENYETLEGLTSLCGESGYCLAFDLDAYKISSSKILSDNLFKEYRLPAPKHFPGGCVPYITKPDSGSGSHGVEILRNKDEAIRFLERAERLDGRYIVQEYLEGPSYSIEVIGKPGCYRAYEIARIFTDDSFDSYRVAVLHDLSPEKENRIKELGVKIADIINLKGIMDLEVIEHDGEMKIIEIDARFPSQTPIAVFHASGMNYMEEIYELFTTGGFKTPFKNTMDFASVTHLLAGSDGYSACGEHVMTEGGLLKLSTLPNSGTEMISDFGAAANGSNNTAGERNGTWRAMLINRGATSDELEEREKMMYDLIDSETG